MSSAFPLPVHGPGFCPGCQLCSPWGLHLEASAACCNGCPALGVPLGCSCPGGSPEMQCLAPSYSPLTSGPASLTPLISQHSTGLQNLLATVSFIPILALASKMCAFLPLHLRPSPWDGLAPLTPVSLRHSPFHCFLLLSAGCPSKAGS